MHKLSNIKFENSKKSYLLAWTTTPWTLPSNLACAVGNEIDYSILESDEETVTLDFNHPMAGKSLNFEIELMSIDEGVS